MKHPTPSCHEDVGPPTAPASWRRHYLPIVAGVAVVALAVVVAVFAWGFVAWASSTCNGTPVEIAAKRHDLRQSLVVLWSAVTVVPILCAGVAKRLERRAWPWLPVAGASLLLAGYQGLTAQPGTWCLF